MRLRLALLFVMAIIVTTKTAASNDDDEEEFVDWIKESWTAVKILRPGISGDIRFDKLLQNDLCEAKMDPARCWESSSTYQQSIVVDSGPSFGRVLYLNCEPQSSTGDEHIYHESLVHPAMITHGAPRRVFIAGGGEGGTAREILRYPGVEKVIMVDLDAALVQISQDHLPYWDGVIGDSRMELHIGDALTWLREHEGTFDVVILDLPDCTSETAMLYRPQIFELVKSRLAEGGVVGSHAGGDICTSHDRMDCRFLPMMLNTWGIIYGNASPLFAPLPMWQILHGFIVGSANTTIPAHALTEAQVNERLQRLLGENYSKLRYYGGDTHVLMTSPKKDYAAFLEDEEMTTKEWRGDVSARRMSPIVECGCDPTKCLDEDGHRGATPLPPWFTANQHDEA